MLSSLDYLGRSWGVKTRKVWGGAVQCGRGQGNAQQMRTRCEQRTETFGAVRAEDKNFLPATSLAHIWFPITKQFLAGKRAILKGGPALAGCNKGRATGLHESKGQQAMQKS